MFRNWVALLAGLVLALAACGGGQPALTPVPSPAAETPAPTPTAAPAAFSSGDWVEVITAQDCLEVVIGPPGQFADTVTNCLPDGFIGLVVDGPVQGDGPTWWALAGQGWVAEDSVQFHHTGGLPYPQRPEVASAGRIAFVGPDGDVWIMNADASRKRKLYELDAQYTNLVELRWSPDGSKLAVQSNNEFRAIISAGGDSLLQLEEGFTFQGWSPTGDAFAAARFPEDKREGIYLDVLALEGKVIAEFRNLDPNTKPSFSPDGRRIVFSRGVDYIVADTRALGAQPIVLEQDPASAEALSQPPALWSPRDLSLIVYGQRLVNLDTGERRSLPGAAVSWSPDGRFLFLVDCEQPPIQALIYDVERSTVVLTYEVPISGSDSPCWSTVRGVWSSEGGYFLYFRPEDGEIPPRTFALQVWDAASGQAYTIGRLRTVGQFSPDGQHILFGSSPGFSAAFSWIWIIDRDGSHYTLLADGDAPAWQPQP